MEIKREIQEKLSLWKKSSLRKPLILKGARQVGKTWLLKDFGKKEFENLAYFNFEEQPELKQFFTSTRDVRRILQNLALVHGKAIEPLKTLIIFDEIQECNEALNSLKYFQENANEYYIACAGSLLGITLARGFSFPVGKVDFLTLYPLSFSEFLSAAEPDLFSYTGSISNIEPIPDIFFSKLTDQFKKYFICGGMPEAVTVLLEQQDVTYTQNVLRNILDAYLLDFSKYADNRTVPRIVHIWTSIPSQLARENKKFLYQTVKSGARAREYEDAIMWLSQTGLVYKVFRNNKPSLPLSAYDDVTAFKLYLSDVGLLRRLSGLDPVAIKEGNRLFVEFKGALSENYVLQSLVTQFEPIPRYWTSEGKAEVDFLIQYENLIIPAEVKSDENVRSKSLAYFNKSFKSPVRVRYSLRNLTFDNGLLNIPLFLSDSSQKLISLALNRRQPLDF